MHSPRFRGINPFYHLWICYLPVLDFVITLCHCYYNGSEKKSASFQQPSRVCVIASGQVKERNYDSCTADTICVCFQVSEHLHEKEKIRCWNLVTKIGKQLNQNSSHLGIYIHLPPAVKPVSSCLRIEVVPQPMLVFLYLSLSWDFFPQRTPTSFERYPEPLQLQTIKILMLLSPSSSSQLPYHNRFWTSKKPSYILLLND